MRYQQTVHDLQLENDGTDNCLWDGSLSPHAILLSKYLLIFCKGPPLFSPHFRDNWLQRLGCLSLQSTERKKSDWLLVGQVLTLDPISYG